MKFGISYWVWGSWVILLVVSFSVMETLALMHGQPTLSASVWTWQKNFPLLEFAAGALAGGLAVHFFWIGNPNVEKGN